MLGVPEDSLMDGRGRHGNHAKGQRSHRWNGGRIISEHGYAKVRVGVGHPLADPNGYAYEHLVVWVSSGGRMPSKTELLHHKNGCKTDNRLDNLEIMQREEHSRMHIDQRSRDASGRLLDGREWNDFPGGEK